MQGLYRLVGIGAIDAAYDLALRSAEFAASRAKGLPDVEGGVSSTSETAIINARMSSLVEDSRSFDELRVLGAGKPAPDEVARLYRRAFAEYGVRALWSRRPSEQPTVAQALTIADALRAEGDLRARALAVEIEAFCRAVV